jgi:hypothetical protein
MITEVNRIIVSEGPCDICSVHVPHIHHRNFPECGAQGETTADAARNLMNLFVKNLASALFLTERDGGSDLLNVLAEGFRRQRERGRPA